MVAALIVDASLTVADGGMRPSLFICTTRLFTNGERLIVTVYGDAVGSLRALISESCADCSAAAHSVANAADCVIAVDNCCNLTAGACGAMFWAMLSSCCATALRRSGE